MSFFLTLLMLFSSIKSPAEESRKLIPQKIWQTYKTKELPAPAKKAQFTWLKKNLTCMYALFDDNEIEKYIQEKWDTDTLAFYKALPLGVMKADLWRYLILATEGGIYSDIDSICCAPIRLWLSKVQNPSENILLLGLENDVHFCQWTITATQNHPAMHYVCRYVVEKWNNQGIDTQNPHFVHATTGPGVWTEALLSYIGESHSTPGEVYKRYQSDARFQQKLHSLGIYLFDEDFYNGFASRNLYGSQKFGDGYVRWTDEAAKLQTR